MNGLFSRMEVLVAGVLILVFLFRAASRCKETKVGLQGETPAQTIADSVIVKRDGEKTYTGEKDLLAEALRKKKKELAAQKAAAQKDSLRKTAGDSLRQTTAAAPATAPTPPAGRLYITIDKLKLRSAPGLKSKVLGELPLFSEVYFMEEVTDSIYSLSLGKAMAHEPYVKVKTKKGTVGWVYGAGVHFYKKKREGVLE